jgi:acid phosphatase (class A)
MKNSSVLVALILLSLSYGCAGAGTVSRPAALPEAGPQFLAGYLAPEALPDSSLILPPPPGAGSAAQALDEELNRGLQTLRGTRRWSLAAQDADTTFPQAAGIFSCAVNAPLSERDTPHLYLLLRRTIADAAQSTGKAKARYRRPRPFAVNGQPICTPENQKYITDGSYPSGHATVGWAWALILTEIAPERADAILARGLAFGDSRAICNVHWPSDVAAGRVMGAGTVARLHADPRFQADLSAAKAEFADLRSKGAPPQRDCAAEAAALAP